MLNAPNQATTDPCNPACFSSTHCMSISGNLDVRSHDNLAGEWTALAFHYPRKLRYSLSYLTSWFVFSLDAENNGANPNKSFS
jgi:hypothetical protein